jgi:hypothetical protein
MPPLKPENDPERLHALREMSWTPEQREVAAAMADLSIAEKIVFAFNRYGLNATAGFIRDMKVDRQRMREAALTLRKVPAFKLLGDICAVAAERKPKAPPPWPERYKRRRK